LEEFDNSIIRQFDNLTPESYRGDDSIIRHPIAIAAATGRMEEFGNPPVAAGQVRDKKWVTLILWGLTNKPVQIRKKEFDYK
jgi:hypothetical protein